MASVSSLFPRPKVLLVLDAIALVVAREPRSPCLAIEADAEVKGYGNRPVRGRGETFVCLSPTKFRGDS